MASGREHLKNIITCSSIFLIVLPTLLYRGHQRDGFYLPVTFHGDQDNQDSKDNNLLI